MINGLLQRDHDVILKSALMIRYRVKIFYIVIDLLSEELRDRFNETNTELLKFVPCLSPCDGFSAFD